MPLLADHRTSRTVGLVLACCCFLLPAAQAQSGGNGGARLAVPEIESGFGNIFTVYVSVRERSGIPLSVPALVRLTSVSGGQSTIAPARDAATAVFTNVVGGEYEAEVEAPGYEKTTERIYLSGGSPYTAYVYLSPVGTTSENGKPAAGVVMTPELQRELDRGLMALNNKQFDEARKHLQKAHKIAPSNPDVIYLLGTVAYAEKDVAGARKQFESVLAAYPTHQRSLLMLGQIQLDAGESKEAQLTLEKAVDAAPVNWQAHYLLAVACARTGSYEKARVECQRTAELNKENKSVTDLLEAKLYLMEGKGPEARDALDAFLRHHPTDPAVPEVKAYLAKFEEASKAQVKPVDEVIAVTSTPSSKVNTPGEPVSNGAPAFVKAWAPPEVDDAVPPIAPGVGCSSDEILKKAQKRALAQLADLEKFGATEHIEHQFIDAHGVPGPAVTQDFDYLIFVHHSKNLPYYFDEMRNGAESLYSFPTAYATRGLVSLGFMVIHPVFSQDFQFTCEGLGTWKGQPAWQIHFAQRGDVTSRVRSWSYQKVIYPVALKGRIWIGANSYNIVHLETGLRDPVQPLRLEREQLLVDYGPVQFRSAKVELWLPEHADMYFDMQGRRYHHQHTLTNYVLFNVDTQNKIADPHEGAEEKNK